MVGERGGGGRFVIVPASTANFIFFFISTFFLIVFFILFYGGRKAKSFFIEVECEGGLGQSLVSLGDMLHFQCGRKKYEPLIRYI